MRRKPNVSFMMRRVAAIVTVVILCGFSGVARAASQDIAISQASDDAREDAAGAVEIDDPGLTMGEYRAAVGVRFNGVNVPRGTELRNAYIQFTCREPRDPGPCFLFVHGEAADNAVTFAETTGNISSRDWTRDFTLWYPTAWDTAGEAGDAQRTWDLSSVIQEIIDRPGWVSGNSLAIIISGPGPGLRTAEAYSGGGAVLHMEWRNCIGFAQAYSSGPEDGNVVNIEVALSSRTLAATITVDYAITDISTGNGDYSPYLGSGTLTFDPGVTSQFIPVTILDDAIPEQAEQFRLTLSNLSDGGAGLGLEIGDNNEHIYTIYASDLPPDWPMWRYDANRTAATDTALPSALHLQWVLELATPLPAWPPTQTKLQFDRSYEPVVMGDKIFVPSMVHDSVTAYDTETGAEQWRFYGDGPVRFAPVAVDGRVYFASDDGCLYCLNASDGTLRWKFQGVPSDRKIVGNKRLISTWPARGGPVYRLGTIYFAASIWPFMGVFIYALDAETGEIVWVNSGEGSRWMDQPHSGAVSFASVAPQGHLAAADDVLLVPSGRSVPGGFDSTTGELLFFRLSEHPWGNEQGGTEVAAIGNRFFCGPGESGMYRLSDGSPDQQINWSVLTLSRVYEESGGSIRARTFPSMAVVWTYPASGYHVLCKAGNRLYAGATNRVMAIDDLGGSAAPAWTKTIVGTPTSMLAADDKLFAVTREGYLYCFGETGGGSLPSGGPKPITWPPTDGWTASAEDILSETGQDEGYCLVLGVGTGRLMEELARLAPELRVIGLDPSSATVQTLRTRWEGMGVPNERLSILEGDIFSVQLPPYLANLIVSEDLSAAGTAQGNAFVEKVFYSLRPYGGLVCFSGDVSALFEQGIAAGGLAHAAVRLSAGYTLLERVGALRDSADWGHQYADAANSVVSKDKQVKAPLGLLWFGGASHAPILPRHGHGPSEQVAGGRLFIEGPDIMRAVDVYTGRVLWEKSLPGLGRNYNNTAHEPGANHIGSNYATAEDGVYVCYGTQCLRLDPASGDTLGTFKITDPTYGDAIFSQVKIWDDLLIVAADPIDHPGAPGLNNWDQTCSRDLVVMDRYAGTVLWSRTSNHSFHHNTIIVGNDILYCIDRVPPGQVDALSRRGITASDIGAPWELFAFDVRTSEVIWSTTADIFGTWLGYSEEYGVLIQSGRQSRDMVSGEPTGRIIAYNGSDGSVLWDKSGQVSDGPYLLHHDTIIMQSETSGAALDLLTGAVRTRVHPMTGAPVSWDFSRTYGCNSAVGAENLLTFRSGAAGYFDLRHGGGTGNLGGFKSGCTSNLIPANGVLNAPDYTRTCTCAYQNQTSLAMVYMPEAEMWTYDPVNRPVGPIKRVGINFGAPGDRVTDRGTVWLDYPSVGSTSPNIAVGITPGSPKWFRHHSARFESNPMGWVTASGAIGLTNATVALGNSTPRAYRVRLYFAEPEGAQAGERVFHVDLQGTRALTDFDIAALATSDGAAVMQEFNGVMVGNTLTVTLTPAASSPIPEPAISGIEAVLETEVIPSAVEFVAASSSGPESASPALLEVQLSPSGESVVTVDYEVSGGTATGGGVDYTLSSGTLTFDLYEISKLILIPINDDPVGEGNETIVVTLSNVTGAGATLGGLSSHTYTIADNDIPPTVTLTAPADHARYQRFQNITLRATASDSDGTVTKVEFYEGANLLGTDTTGAGALGNEYEFTWAGTAEGHYVLTARATDNGGAIGVSAPVHITVLPDLPDLLVRHFGFSPQDASTDGGTTITLSGIVANEGSRATTQSFRVEFRVSPKLPVQPTDPYLCDSLVVSSFLAPGTTESLSLPRTTYALEEGYYYVCAFVDAIDEIEEQREDNNACWSLERLRVGDATSAQYWMLYE